MFLCLNGSSRGGSCLVKAGFEAILVFQLSIKLGRPKISVGVETNKFDDAVITDVSKCGWGCCSWEKSNIAARLHDRSFKDKTVSIISRSGNVSQR